MVENQTKIVDLKRMADIMRISQRRVNQLVKQDVFDKESRGQYDWEKCNGAYIEWLRQKAEGRNKEAKSGRENKERLTKAQADKYELEADILRGTLLNANEVKQGLSDLAGNCKTRMMAIAPKVSPQLAGMEDPEDIRKLLDATIREALEEVSNYVPDIQEC